jgi:hypothetical protein
MRIYYAIRRGDLVRPTICEKCGGSPSLTKNGRPQIHAHHPRGYTDPLDIEWICFKCHRNEPGHAAQGEDHGMSKLTTQQVLAIREGIKRGENRRGLARLYGVSYTTIKMIKRGDIWRHV